MQVPPKADMGDLYARGVSELEEIYLIKLKIVQKKASLK
jgi:hypothetical protein